MRPPPRPRCVRACACARSLLPTGASACTAVLSLTLSRCLSLAPSLAVPLSVCFSRCSARAHSLSSSFLPHLSVSPLPFTSVSHPIPLAVTVIHSFSISPALSSFSRSCFLSLSRKLFLLRNFSVSHAFLLSLSFSLSCFLSLSLSLPSLSLKFQSLSFCAVSSLFLFHCVRFSLTQSRTPSLSLCLFFSSSSSLFLTLSLARARSLSLSPQGAHLCMPMRVHTVPAASEG